MKDKTREELFKQIYEEDFYRSVFELSKQLDNITEYVEEYRADCLDDWVSLKKEVERVLRLIQS